MSTVIPPPSAEALRAAAAAARRAAEIWLARGARGGRWNALTCMLEANQLTERAVRYEAQAAAGEDVPG